MTWRTWRGACVASYDPENARGVSSVPACATRVRSPARAAARRRSSPMLQRRSAHPTLQDHAHAALALPAAAAAHLGELLQRVGRAGAQRRGARADREARATKPRTVFAAMSVSADAQQRTVHRRRGGGASHHAPRCGCGSRAVHRLQCTGEQLSRRGARLIPRRRRRRRRHVRGRQVDQGGRRQKGRQSWRQGRGVRG